MTKQPNVDIYPFEMWDLPEKFQMKAEIELKDTPENRQIGLQEMREMIKNDKYFDGLHLEDEFLLYYLRCRKYDVRRAFSQLRGLIILRRKLTNVFCKFNFENLAITTRDKIVTILPWRCADGCAIMLVQLDNWDPEKFPVEEVKRAVAVFLFQACRYIMTQINGYKIIFDVKSNVLRHIKYVTPSNMYLLYYGTVECAPARFKSIHILNDSATFKLAYFLVKPFLSNKIKQRIIFHSKPEELLDFFPSSIIPLKYGGTLEDYDMTDWLKEAIQSENLPTVAKGIDDLS